MPASTLASAAVHRHRVALALRRRIGPGRECGTAKQLAGLIGYAPSSISVWLKGSSDPSSHAMAAMTKVFGAPFLVEIFGELAEPMTRRRPREVAAEQLRLPFGTLQLTKAKA